MIPRDPEDPWKCDVCGTAYPVAVLARDCENRHDEETRP